MTEIHLNITIQNANATNPLPRPQSLPLQIKHRSSPFQQINSATLMQPHPILHPKLTNIAQTDHLTQIRSAHPHQQRQARISVIARIIHQSNPD
jgi:hypothetical protein